MYHFTIRRVRSRLVGTKFTSLNQAGVTLFELMVAMALVAVLSAATIPPFLKWRADARFRGVLGQVIGHIQLAKGRAIRINDSVAMVFTRTGYTVFDDNGSVSNDYIRQPDELSHATVTFVSGIYIDLSKTTFVGDKTRFTGRGVTPRAGTLVLRGPGGRQNKVVISRIGRIRTE